MKLKYIYTLIIYSLIALTINSQKALAQTKNMGISSIDSEIELKKKQVEELENLKRSIMKAKLGGKNLKVGVALSGGGSKGVAHIGVLKVLEENNIPIDYISGTSMGAIVASLYATGYSPDEIEVVVKTMDWDYRLSNEPLRKDIPLESKFKSEKYFASITYDEKLNISLPKGLLTGEKSYLKLKELLWDVKDIKSFDELSPKLRIVATDFNTGEAKSFDRGDLAHIVSASMAIPTVYDPVKIDNRIYVDGMVSRNLPVEDLFEAGANIVIASDVGAPLVEDLDYNLLTVVTKISSYRGVESTEKQRKLATILIDPNVKLEDGSVFKNFDSYILEGKVAAKAKLKEIDKYDLKESEKRKYYKKSETNIYIDKIKVINSKYLTESTVEDNLNKALPNKFNYRDLEELTMRLYAMPYIEKSYYHIDGSTLVVDVSDTNLNHMRIGLNYNSDIGTKLAIGTDLTKIGKIIGRITSLELEVGEYKSLEFNNFWYYGKNNKIGLNFNLGYDELPLFIYERNSLKAKAIEKNKFLNLGLTTQLFRQMDISAGTRYVENDVKFNVGEDKFKDELDKKDRYQDLYLKLILDRKNKITYPTRGNYLELKHEVGGIGTDEVEYYSELGIIEGYIPLTSKLSFSGALSGGTLSGAKIPLGRHFKIGGTNNRLDDNYVSFYGYNMVRKLASEFLIGQVGMQYMVYTKVYLVAKANILTYTGVEDESIIEDGSLMFEDNKIGYGVTLGYDSIVGPLELSLTNDADSDNDYIVTVSMGYIF